MRPRRRLRLLSFAALGVATLLAACNAITGARDREPIIDGGASGRKDQSAPPDDDDDDEDATAPPLDGGVDATTVITVDPTTVTTWSSPNMATAGFDGGTVIASYNPPKDNHPMLVPIPLPEIPTDKYTVRARILANEQAEYGIFVRGRNIPNGFGVFVLSSRYSDSVVGTNRPFLAPLTTRREDGLNDDPSLEGVSNGKSYAFEAGKVWIFQIDVDGSKLTGSIRREDAPAADPDMTITDPTPVAERGLSFGFYGFRTPKAALLQLQLIYTK